MVKSLDPGSITPVINSKEDPLSIEETFDTIIELLPPGTERSADEEWFAIPKTFSEIPPERAAQCRIDLMITGNDARIFFTWDGIRYGGIEESTVLKADSPYSKKTGVEEGNTFNIKADQNVTVQRCVVVVEKKQETS